MTLGKVVLVDLMFSSSRSEVPSLQQHALEMMLLVGRDLDDLVLKLVAHLLLPTALLSRQILCIVAAEASEARQ